MYVTVCQISLGTKLPLSIIMYVHTCTPVSAGPWMVHCSYSFVSGKGTGVVHV